MTLPFAAALVTMPNFPSPAALEPPASLPSRWLTPHDLPEFARCDSGPTTRSLVWPGQSSQLPGTGALAEPGAVGACQRQHEHSATLPSCQGGKAGPGASGHPWEHPCSEADLSSSSSSQHPAEGASITAGCKEGVEALLRVPSHGAGAGPHARCLPHATGTGRAGGHSMAELYDHDGGSQPLHCLWQGQHVPKGSGCWLRQ